MNHEKMDRRQLLSLLFEGAPFILRNAAKRISFRLGNIGTKSGTYHLDATLEESVRYIRGVFHDYKFYGGVDAFHGRVAEVGTGDSCGVGISFLLDGCKQVDLIDKFYSARNIKHQRDIIKALLPASSSLSLNSHTQPPDEESIEGLSRHYGAQASSEKFFQKHTGYDFIISRAVLEHVDNPEHSLSLMAEALNPNGMLLHKVDLRDHGMFSSRHDELTFLKIPQWYYALMTRGSGKPNRVLTHRYKDILDRSGLDYKILVTRLVGVGEITPHVPWEMIDRRLREGSLAKVKSLKNSLAREFRKVDDKFLSIAGIFIVAKKSEHSSPTYRAISY